MSCNCSDLKAVVRADTSAPPTPGLHLVGERHDGWLQLFRCKQCGQHWQIDTWDKLQVGLAIKIDKPVEWDAFDDTPFRKRYLLDTRGGHSSDRCRWEGCGSLCIRGLEFCVDHAYERMGLRD